MLSLHQLRCFLTAYEHGSLTAAAEELGYAQPSVSEQIRKLEQTLGIDLFTRVGRGVVPTDAGHALRPHAERAIEAAEGARRAMASVTALETGTIRFGMFADTRLYDGAALIADVLERHPGVRVELVGAHSSEVLEDLRRGRIEAAMLAVSQAYAEGLEVTPVARVELVYISNHPDHLTAPVTAARLAQAELVMSETTWRADDSSRVVLRKMLLDAGHNPRTRLEVEDIETAVEIVGRGLADSVIPKGAAEQLLPRLAPNAGYVSMSPKQWITIAIVHRSGATLSPGAQLMIELATKRMQEIAEPIRRRRQAGQSTSASGTTPSIR